jgi:hypothetical protein
MIPVVHTAYGLSCPERFYSHEETRHNHRRILATSCGRIVGLFPASTKNRLTIIL